MLQVLATCDKYHVRLTGELYAQCLKTQLHFSNSNRGFDDMRHTLQHLKPGGKNWTLLLDAGDKSALCAVLS